MHYFYNRGALNSLEQTLPNGIIRYFGLLDKIANIVLYQLCYH